MGAHAVNDHQPVLPAYAFLTEVRSGFELQHGGIPYKGDHVLITNAACVDVFQPSWAFVEKSHHNGNKYWTLDVMFSATATHTTVSVYGPELFIERPDQSRGRKHTVSDLLWRED